MGPAARPHPTNPSWAPIAGPRYQPGRPLHRADLHLHSSYSYDVLDLPALRPRALYERARLAGMGYFTLTDHETIRGVLALRQELRQELGSELPIPVINGVEIKINDPRVGHIVHVNVLGLEPPQLGDLARRRRNLDRFLGYCRAQRLYHAYNHPFWFEAGQRADVATVARLIEEFPVVELNAGRIPQLNHRTAELARRADAQLVAASDSHTGRVGRAYTLAPGNTPEEFLGNVIAGNSIVVPKNTSLNEFCSEVQDVLDLIFSSGAAFRIKRTFLRRNRIARSLVRATLGSDRIMRRGLAQRTVRGLLELLSYPAATLFILQQRRMDLRLAESPPASTTERWAA
ncbi:MAG: PHP-associated domain-containing protein [Candidatus Eisenbacteria bacterium]|uniref:PHP domain-containing protein n=1 Tax=Eiseniibacteriota bacterium TaxID=2212470 RepID=A0A956RPN5_UNCEI|nr:PHP domain-containing protein [Candidatus Eisenbacteria bacterium]